MPQVLLSAGRLRLGPSSEVLDDGAVLVEGATILAVGHPHDLRQQGGADLQEVRLGASTVLIPGLINTHVHLCFDPNGQDRVASIVESSDALLRWRIVRHARALLMSGVTTARDLGDRGELTLDVRDAIARGDEQGSRLVVSGPPITSEGGHCWFLGGEVQPDAEALRARVRHLAARGVDVVKVMASGGEITAGGAHAWEAQFDHDALSVIVSEARRHGLPVAAHAHGTTSIAAALSAGVDTVEHCTFQSGPGTFDYQEDLARKMAETQTFLGTASAADWRWLAERVGMERVRLVFGRWRELHDLGVPILLGTDAGLGPFDDFPEVLIRHCEWGFSPAEALDAATVTAAKGLKLQDNIGRIAAGFEADLVALPGDPVGDIKYVATPTLVVARGQLVLPNRPSAFELQVWR